MLKQYEIDFENFTNIIDTSENLQACKQLLKICQNNKIPEEYINFLFEQVVCLNHKLKEFSLNQTFPDYYKLYSDNRLLGAEVEASILVLHNTSYKFSRCKNGIKFKNSTFTIGLYVLHEKSTFER